MTQLSACAPHPARQARYAGLVPRTQLWLVMLAATAWPLSCCCDEPECGDDVRDPGELCFSDDQLSLDFELTTPLALRAGRFDADGFDDLIVLGTDATGVTGRLLRGDGDGGLGKSRKVGVYGCSAYPISGDLGDDGRDDLVFATCTNSLLVFRGAGDGFAEPFEVPIGVAVRQTTITDVDGDGLRDLLVLGINDAGLPALSFAQSLPDQTHAPAFLTLMPAPALAMFTPSLMAAARVERDGPFEVVIAEPDRPNALYRTRYAGLAAFSPPEPLTTDLRPTGLGLRDLDRDDRLDLVLADREKQQLVGLLFDGQQFGDGGYTPLDVAWASLVFGQLDDDGWLDLAVIDENRVALMRGVGDGSFAEGTALEFPAPVVELSLFDLNRDGRDDLVAGTFEGDSPLTIALSSP